MNYTLHVTNRCNLRCAYCYHRQSPEDMRLETALAAVELAAKGDPPSAGIVFFGGEPLLRRQLIYDVIRYCRERERRKRTRFHFKITTNGLLLDDGFIAFSIEQDLFIALSHDGTKKAHDACRRDAAGGTYDRLEPVVSDLLAARPYSPVLMTVHADNAGELYEGVRRLFDKGFLYIICSLDYSGPWNDGKLRLLKQQYEALAELYYQKTLNEDKFFLSPFEVKLASHIRGDNYCRERCELGRKQLSVAPDGILYPCTQFVGRAQYAIGSVEEGIDEARRLRLYRQNESRKAQCAGCAIERRCNCRCGCMNLQTTGSIETISPVQCEHERLLLPIADRLAARLYKARSPMFIQKHYNDVYPLISMAEDLKR